MWPEWLGGNSIQVLNATVLTRLVATIDKAGAYNKLEGRSKPEARRLLLDGDPEAFFRLLKAALVSIEMPRLQFDCLTLDTRCAQLLESICKNEALHVILGNSSFSPMLRSTKRHAIVLDTLSHAEGMAMANLELDPTKDRVPDYALSAAGTVISEFISKEGGSELTKSRAFKNSFRRRNAIPAINNPSTASSESDESPTILPYSIITQLCYCQLPEDLQCMVAWKHKAFFSDVTKELQQPGLLQETAPV